MTGAFEHAYNESIRDPDKFSDAHARRERRRLLRLACDARYASSWLL
jgi:hypothetical protein